MGAIRPDDIKIFNLHEEIKDNTLKGKIIVRTFLGRDYQYEIATELGNFLVNYDALEIFFLLDKKLIYIFQQINYISK